MVYLGFKCQKQNVLLYFIKRKILEFKLWVKIINFQQCKRKLYFKDKNLGKKKIIIFMAGIAWYFLAKKFNEFCLKIIKNKVIWRKILVKSV